MRAAVLLLECRHCARDPQPGMERFFVVHCVHSTTHNRHSSKMDPTLLTANNKKIDELSEGVQNLKYLSMEIGLEAKEQNALLDQMVRCLGF